MTGKEVTTLKFSQKFEWFGPLTSRKTAYSKQAGAAYQQYNKTRCQIVATIETTWYEILAAKALTKVVNEIIILISQLITLSHGYMQRTASNTFSSILELQIDQSEKQSELIHLQQPLNSLCILFTSLLICVSTSNIT